MLMRVFVFALSIASALGQRDKLPVVTGMQVVPRSLKEHNTDYFEIELGFAIRRGQNFQLSVETSAPLNSYGEELTIDVDVVCKEYCVGPEFKSKIIKSNHKKNKYVIDVFTPVNTPIGKYDNVVLYVNTLKKGSSVEAYLYEYPFPMYLLFNPFLPADVDVYIPDKYTQYENILNQYGNVYQGSLNAYDGQVWYYGSEKQVVLDAAFHLLNRFLDRARANHTIDVAQAISHNQGMMRTTSGGILVGTEDALLEGNWGDFPFEDDNSPEIWSSTPDILNRWKSTGKPTKYGQCWVFGALETSLMRAIGIGARQVSAFGAPIDSSASYDKDKKPHHVIDTYYDKNGTTIKMDGQLWNFHSWTDIFIKRQPVEYSGWQNNDGTPPGMGPAPINAIHELDDNADYNTSQAISTVHSTLREFLVTCNRNHKKDDGMKGCKVEKLLKYDPTGLKLILSSQSLKNGSLDKHDVTLEYVDPNKDAFIPFKDRKDLPVDQKDSDDLKIAPHSYEVIVGEPIDGNVVFKTKDLNAGEELEINVRITLESRTGVEMKVLYTLSENVKYNGEVVHIPYHADPATYVQENLHEAFIKIVTTASTTGIDYGVRTEHEKSIWMDTSVLQLDAPDITITIPEKIVAGQREPIPITASFTNPWDRVLPHVCLMIHSHKHAIHASPNTRVSKCASLKPGETLVHRIWLEAPTKAQSSYLVASVQGDFIPLSQDHVSIVVQEAPEATKETSILGDISSFFTSAFSRE